MPHFLSTDEIYRVLQRELPPDDVYPDGSPSAFFSTADNYAFASTVADSYTSLSGLYLDYFPNTATGALPDHEIAYFGYNLDASLGLDQRRALLLNRIRRRLRPTPQDVLTTVYSIIDPSIPVELSEWGNASGGWLLDYSQLDIDTYLNSGNNLIITGGNLCQLDADDFGLTQEEFDDYRDVYNYSVLIYGYTLTAQQRTALDLALDAAEPARSMHFIYDGLNPNDMIGGGS